MCKTRNIFINLLVISFIIVIAIFNNNVSANLTIDDGNIYYYEIVNEEVKLTQCHFRSFPNVKIPEEIEGYPVTIIASYAAGLDSMAEKVDNIIIPDSVVTIEENAFLMDDIYACDYIKDFTIPKSVQTIGSSAIGYKLAVDTPHIKSYERMKDIVIRGYKGTAAETYALQNRFTFIALDDEPITTTTPVITTTTTTQTTVVTTQTTAVSSTATSSSVSTTSIAETTPVTTTVTIPEIKGDANGDGKLSANDAAYIAKELAQSSISGEKITAEDYPSMDFNQDGKITAKDAADIARYLAEQSISDNKKV